MNLIQNSNSEFKSPYFSLLTFRSKKHYGFLEIVKERSFCPPFENFKHGLGVICTVLAFLDWIFKLNGKDICVIRSAQRRRSHPAFIVIMRMKLVSVRNTHG
jgi:hypothetical protein